MTHQGLHINYVNGQQIVARMFGGVGNFATYLLTYLLTISSKLQKT